MSATQTSAPALVLAFLQGTGEPAATEPAPVSA